MANYVDYIKSISYEIKAIQDRVRHFVKHYGEDGRYKESILIDLLRQKLPQSISIGTGFVMSANDEPSTQIDIIIYSDIYPLYFKQGDFVIVNKASVLGILEVKTRFNNSTELIEAIKKSYNNKKLIGKGAFNGIFSFECDLNMANNGNLETFLRQKYMIDEIVFNNTLFMKYWRKNMPSETYTKPHYSFYSLQDMAIGYFISNIIENVNIKIRGKRIPKSVEKFLYPIEGAGKEGSKIKDIDIIEEVER